MLVIAVDTTHTHTHASQGALDVCVCYNYICCTIHLGIHYCCCCCFCCCCSLFIVDIDNALLCLLMLSPQVFAHNYLFVVVVLCDCPQTRLVGATALAALPNKIIYFYSSLLYCISFICALAFMAAVTWHNKCNNNNNNISKYKNFASFVRAKKAGSQSNSQAIEYTSTYVYMCISTVLKRGRTLPGCNNARM